jgi:cell division protein FtsL
VRVAATLGAVPVCDTIDVVASACPIIQTGKKRRLISTENHKLFCHFKKLDIYRFLKMVQLQSCVF